MQVNKVWQMKRTCILFLSILLISVFCSCSKKEIYNPPVSCIYNSFEIIDDEDVSIALSGEEQQKICDILNGCQWLGNAYDCGWDYVITTSEGTFRYCSDCATISNMKNNGGHENLSDTDEEAFEALLKK